MTLVISVLLVILVVFAFLRSIWATSIPSVAVPLSLVGTFGVMYLAGYTIDNLSLMALTISTGFVVDDAIVVIENITRYLEKGMTPFEAALEGSREIGFTVLSMSTSLVAVFIPILLMGGIVGRMFREFAVTLSVAVAISMVVSLTTTPAMCAKLLKSQTRAKSTTGFIASAKASSIICTRPTPSSLRWVLRTSALRPGRHVAPLSAWRSISTSSFPRASSRSRIPAAFSARPALARMSPSSPCGRSSSQYVAIVQSRSRRRQ